MPKYLHSELNWDLIQYVGFDLDGTLYDEYEFISQVYQPIALKLAKYVPDNSEVIYHSMLQRWLEKGSSYNKIFDEILLTSTLSSSERSMIINQCLHIFRSFQPSLTLSPRVKMILDWLSARFALFIVTDGGMNLQMAKISSLNLYRWFSPDNISISGCSMDKISKPDVRMASQVKILNIEDLSPSSVVYFGDRSVDAGFAKNCGFNFIQVRVMMPLSLCHI